MIEIYTDGACSKNGQKENFGGFAVVVVINNKVVKCYQKGVKNTTNNAMELQGILTAIKFGKILTKNDKKEIIIYSDSAYSVNTINTWMYSWASNSWIKKSDKKPPENLELIKEIYDLMQFERNIKVKKIAGHNGHEFNEMADILAKEEIKKLEKEYLRKENINE